MSDIEALIFSLLESELTEAKYIGSFKGSRFDREILAAGHRAFAPDQYKKEVYSKSRSARQSWKTQRDTFYQKALDTVGKFRAGELSYNQFKKTFYQHLKEAYFTSFNLGLHSVGMTEFAKFSVLTMVQKADEPEYMKNLTPEEKHYIQHAWKHEVRFLAKFLDDIAGNRLKMPLERRMNMYADALWNIYQSGRFMGKPANSLIYWVTRHDKEVCPSCEYLEVHSPYLKTTLPTMPRSGATVCLTNCRCKIVFKDLDDQQKAQLVASEQRSKVTHINNLRRIKRTRHRVR